MLYHRLGSYCRLYQNNGLLHLCIVMVVLLTEQSRWQLSTVLDQLDAEHAFIVRFFLSNWKHFKMYLCHICPVCEDIVLQLTQFSLFCYVSEFETKFNNHVHVLINV